MHPKQGRAGQGRAAPHHWSSGLPGRSQPALLATEASLTMEGQHSWVIPLPQSVEKATDVALLKGDAFFFSERLTSTQTLLEPSVSMLEPAGKGGTSGARGQSSTKSTHYASSLQFRTWAMLILRRPVAQPKRNSGPSQWLQLLRIARQKGRVAWLISAVNRLSNKPPWSR